MTAKEAAFLLQALGLHQGIRIQMRLRECSSTEGGTHRLHFGFGSLVLLCSLEFKRRDLFLCVLHSSTRPGESYRSLTVSYGQRRQNHAWDTYLHLPLSQQVERA